MTRQQLLKLAPIYTCFAVTQDSQFIFAGMTVDPQNSSKTNSEFFISKQLSSGAWKSMFQPTSMDEDSMPKDRMALLADPAVPSLIYVAGNAGALAWRVDVSKGADAKWTKLWDDDVIDVCPYRMVIVAIMPGTLKAQGSY